MNDLIKYDEAAIRRWIDGMVERREKQIASDMDRTINECLKDCPQLTQETLDKLQEAADELVERLLRWRRARTYSVCTTRATRSTPESTTPGR